MLEKMNASKSCFLLVAISRAGNRGRKRVTDPAWNLDEARVYDAKLSDGL
jgi:hypothetical protein